LNASIAVVVPVYNESENIVQWVQSLLDEFESAQIVVVDASDRDVSILALKKIESDTRFDENRLRIIYSHTPSRALQMNQGAQVCTADVLVFLHADTRLPGDAMDGIRNAVERGFQWGRFDVRLDAPGVFYRIIEWSMNQRSAISSIATGDQAIFIKRALFNEVGGFAAIPLMEDIELCKRLKKIGWPARLRSRVVTSARRWREQGVLCTIVQMWSLRFQYWLGISPEKLAMAYRNVREG
jgi:rSAM/selenodomain-associated transferase 2